jgi:hypothetical protein
MKSKFNEKKRLEVESKIKIFEDRIDSSNAHILSSIKNGSSEEVLNAIISNRNSLSVDLDNLYKQLCNVEKGKSQYGNEIGTRNVRKYIDLNDY